MVSTHRALKRVKEHKNKPYKYRYNRKEYNGMRTKDMFYPDILLPGKVARRIAHAHSGVPKILKSHGEWERHIASPKDIEKMDSDSVEYFFCSDVTLPDIYPVPHTCNIKRWPKRRAMTLERQRARDAKYDV